MFAEKDPISLLSKSMDKETELLNTYFEQEKELFNAVQDRDWEKLEDAISKMEQMAAAVSESEMDREKIFTIVRGIYGGEGREGFYQFIQRLPLELREPLSLSFRNMKIAVFRLQALDMQIQGYLRSASTTLREIVEEIFPHQKGTMYCKKGKTSSPETNPMFISRHL